MWYSRTGPGARTAGWGVPSRIRIPKNSGERVSEADSLIFSSFLGLFGGPQTYLFSLFWTESKTISFSYGELHVLHQYCLGKRDDSVIPEPVVSPRENFSPRQIATKWEMSVLTSRLYTAARCKIIHYSDFRRSWKSISCSKRPVAVIFQRNSVKICIHKKIILVWELISFLRFGPTRTSPDITEIDRIRLRAVKCLTPWIRFRDFCIFPEMEPDLVNDHQGLVWSRVSTDQ